ncbi:TetR/AcrR family transcriptional regulator [Streptomyces sulphureus]|uniref:TetR/AcrR family transcriptional regulator n=1 Tax=Streptomyces sulphureus TaxID=47758 RepID=UPI00038176D0|nr:TetR/AcrR family transcriptional regulator [Streptomyces sulphureus]
MSEPKGGGAPRRRADALRSRASVLSAAVHVLAGRPEAGLDDIAKAAGVSRQTVYAHFGSREKLLDAVLDHVTAEVVAAMDASAAEAESAEAALLRSLEASRRLADRQPLLRDRPLSSERSRELHRPIVERLSEIVRRGQGSGEFGDQLPAAWLVEAIIALAHTAAEQTAADRMTAEEAESALSGSLLRLLRPEP